MEQFPRDSRKLLGKLPSLTYATLACAEINPPPLGQLAERYLIASYEGALLRLGPSLNLFFAGDGISFRGIRLGVYQCDRTTVSCVSRSLAGIVGDQAGICI